MIHKRFSLLAVGALLSAAVSAQSVQDGIRAVYDGKTYAAVNILSKQQNDPEAVYWLTQAYLRSQKVDQAKATLAKGLAAQANNPWLLAAKGQLELIDKKPNEAKQSFEAAISAGKSSAEILNAVGGAMTKEYNNVDKIGDINYAVQKLEAARDAELGKKEKNRNKWLLADIYTNYGDAKRKQNPGDGTSAFSAYQEALTVEPTFAAADYKMAMIFRSQRNVDLYVNNLNKAITADPAFIPAMDELYLYKLLTGDNAGAQELAQKIIQNIPGDPNKDYYAAQTFFVGKQYDQAISAAKSVIGTAKDLANPKAYRVIAYSLMAKKDTAAAIPYLEDLFKYEDPTKLIPEDYTQIGMAYAAGSGQPGKAVERIMQGVNAETTPEGKLEILTNSAKIFADKGLAGVAGDLYAKVLEIKPADKVVINDYFNAGYTGYYKAGQYDKAWKIFDDVRTKFPTSQYGYQLTYASSSIFDSTGQKGVRGADAEKLIAFMKGTESAAKLIPKSTGFGAAYFLATYNNEVAKDKTKAIQYLNEMLSFTDDPAAQKQVQEAIKALSTSGSTPAGTTKPKGGR